jgi:hypothetical protein
MTPDTDDRVIQVYGAGSWRKTCSFCGAPIVGYKLVTPSRTNRSGAMYFNEHPTVVTTLASGAVLELRYADNHWPSCRPQRQHSDDRRRDTVTPPPTAEICPRCGLRVLGDTRLRNFDATPSWRPFTHRCYPKESA